MSRNNSALCSQWSLILEFLSNSAAWPLTGVACHPVASVPRCKDCALLSTPAEMPLSRHLHWVPPSRPAPHLSTGCLFSWQGYYLVLFYPHGPQMESTIFLLIHICLKKKKTKLNKSCSHLAHILWYPLTSSTKGPRAPVPLLLKHQKYRYWETSKISTIEPSRTCGFSAQLSLIRRLKAARQNHRRWQGTAPSHC